MAGTFCHCKSCELITRHRQDRTKPTGHVYCAICGTERLVAGAAPETGDDKLIRAPWTPEQVVELNAYQRNRQVHPFTCGGNRTNAAHLDGEGVLVATPQGWMCPYCDYRQDWAHEFMAKPGPAGAAPLPGQYARTLSDPNGADDPVGPED